MKEINKVTLVGLGAIGSFFAPKLSLGLGDNFRVLAGGARAQRLERNGVTINGENYHFHIISPETAGDEADLIIVSVKGMALEQALSDMKNQVGSETIILPVLNGVDSEKQTAEIYGWDHVLYALMRVASSMKDGCAVYNENSAGVFFGEKINEPGSYSPRVKAVQEVLDRCQIPYQIPEDMIRAQWHKFMGNVGENMTCALLGIPYGAFRTSAHANSIRHAAMEEVAAVANVQGIMIGKEEMDYQDAIVVDMDYDVKPSTLQDLEAGRPTEVDMFAGTVVRMGREYGIPTPVCQMFLDGIHVLEEKNSGEIRA